jgi:hypothetical protein
MPTTTSITTTYAGSFAGKYISAALLSGSTIANGGIEVKPNIKFKEVIKRVATDTIIRNASCDFDATSTVTLTERIIQPEEFQVNLQLCKKDFRSDWEAIEMGISTFDTLPPSFTEFLLSHVISKVAERTENNIWKGVDANVGEFAGFIPLATADATTVKVTGVAITAANVIVEMGKVIDLIPAALYGKEDLYLYAPQNVVKAYVRALGGFAATGLGANGTNNEGTQWYNNGALTFDGVKIFLANGMTNSFMFAAQKSNLYFGTGLLSDNQEVKVIDMGDIDGSQNVRIVMRFTAAVQYGIGSEIVLYTPA